MTNPCLFEVGDRVRRRREGYRPSQGMVNWISLDPVTLRWRVQVYWNQRRRHQAWFTTCDPSHLTHIEEAS